MQGQANRHRREPDFGPKDKVWITAKNQEADILLSQKPATILPQNQADSMKQLEMADNSTLNLDNLRIS
jgi:hypothetical protein